MRSINCRTWKTRFMWKLFQEKTKILLFIILCRHQPTGYTISRVVQTLVGTNLLLWIFIDTNLLETPIASGKHQISKRHQSLCLSDTNLQVTISSLVHITSSKDDEIHITFTESAFYFYLH
jgi:hypothetical protein